MARKRKKSDGAPEVSQETEPDEVADQSSASPAGEVDFLPLLDLNPDGLLVVLPETREVVYANRSAERLLRKKSKQILAEPFPEELTEGPMQKHDLYKKPQPIQWQGVEAVFMLLAPLASQQSSFHVEWRIESAEERAREAEERVAELEQQLSLQPAAPAVDTEAPDKNTQQIAELESQAASLSEELNQTRQEMSVLEAEANTLRERVARQLQTEQEAFAQIRAQEDRGIELQSEMSRLESRLSQTEFDLGRSEQRAQDAERRVHEAEALMEEAESQAQEAERHVEDLSDTLRQVEDELELTKQSLVRSDEKRRTDSELETAHQKAVAELQAAHLELAEQKVQQLNLREQIEFQLSNCDELQAALQEAQEALHESEGIKEQIAGLMDQLKASEEANAQSEGALADAETAQERAEAIRLEAEAARDLANAALEEFKASLSEAETARDQAEMGQLEADEALDQERERLAEADLIRIELEDKLAAAEQRIATLAVDQADSAQVNARITELEAELATAKAAKEQTEAELADIQSLQDELAAENERADELQARLDQADLQLEAVKAGLDEARAQLEEAALRCELDDLARQDAEQEMFRQKQLLEELQQEKDELLQHEAQALQASVLEIERERLLAEEAKQKLAAKEREVDDLRLALEQTQQELEHLRQAPPQVDEKALEDVRGQLEAERAEREQSILELQEILKKLADKELALVELQHQLRELEERASEAEELLEVAEDRAAQSEDRLKSVPADLSPQVALLEARIHEQQEELLRSTLALQELQGRALAAEASFAQLQQAAETTEARWTKRLAVEQENLTVLETASQLHQAEKARLQSSSEEAIREREQLRKQNADLEARAQRAEQQAFQAPAAAQGETPTVDPETEQLAFQDGLTGLPNLNLLKRYLDFALQQTNRYQRHSALFYIDLDRFQVINETLGFEAGNEILLQVAERLQTVVRGSDVLARKGEDEFLILLTEVSGEADSPGSVSVVVRRLYEAFVAPFTAAGQKIQVTCSVGVSSCPGDAQDAPQMLHHAIAALKRAKQLGRARSQFYTDDVQQVFETRVGLERELRRAIDAKEFTLLYQPIVHLPTGRLAGVETLVRWQHPTQGILEPEHFLDVAEETGLLVTLGRWILLQACQQLHHWSSLGLDLLVTVNLSQRQFLQADLADTLQRTLEVTGAPAHSLVVEIPESVQMLDPDRLGGVVAQLRKLGVQIALDHFGAGFSSLERLNVNLASILKLDRKFVRAIPQSPAATGVVTAGIVLAKSLRLKPIAVGVENEAQLSLCRQMGCDFVQGNLIYVPVQASQVAELSKSGRLLFPG